MAKPKTPPKGDKAAANPEMEIVEYAILTKSLRDAIVAELGKLPHHAVRGSIDALLNLRMQKQEIEKQAPPIAPQGATAAPAKEKKADAKKEKPEGSGDPAPQGSKK